MERGPGPPVSMYSTMASAIQCVRPSVSYAGWLQAGKSVNVGRTHITGLCLFLYLSDFGWSISLTIRWFVFQGSRNTVFRVAILLCPPYSLLITLYCLQYSRETYPTVTLTGPSSISHPRVPERRGASGPDIHTGGVRLSGPDHPYPYPIRAGPHQEWGAQQPNNANRTIRVGDGRPRESWLCFPRLGLSLSTGCSVQLKAQR